MKTMHILLSKWVQFLRWSETYTHTDMVYLAGGGFWFLLGKSGIFLVYFAFMFAFANWVPQQTYGNYQFILATMGLLGFFSLPGINTALIRSIAQSREGTLALALKTKLKWSIGGSFGMFFAAAWFFFFHGYTTLPTAFFIGGLLFPFYTIFSLYQAYWIGKKNFIKKSTYEVIAAVLGAATTISVIYLTHNFLLILLTFLISTILIEGFFFWRTLLQTKNREKDHAGIRFGKTLTIITTLSLIAEHIDKILLWKFLGPTQIAIYAFALLPLQKVLSLNPINSLALPRLSESAHANNKKSVAQKFFKGFAITIPAAIAIVALAPLVYQTFFPQYTQSVPYFQVLSIIIALVPFSLLTTTLVAYMQKKELYIVSIVRSVTQVSLYLLLVPLFGIWGAVCSYLTGTIIGNGILFYFFMKPLSRNM